MVLIPHLNQLYGTIDLILNTNGVALTGYVYAVTGGAGMLALTSARALLEHGLTGLALFDLPSAIEKGENAIEALQIEFPSAKIIYAALREWLAVFLPRSSL